MARAASARNKDSKAIGEATTKPKKSELTRQRILDAAARVFAVRGYALTRLEDIAKEADTHAGAIYYYFESREDLVENILVLSSTRVTEYVKETLEGLSDSVGFRERIQIGIRSHFEQLLARDDYTLAYLKIHNQIPREMSKRLVVNPRSYGAFWANLIKTAQAAGVIRADLDPTILRLLLLGAITWSVEWYHPGGGRTPREIAEHLTTMFLDGALTIQPATAGTTSERAAKAKRRPPSHDENF